MIFEEIMKLLREGKKVCRNAWEKDTYMFIEKENIYAKRSDNPKFLYSPNYLDIFYADDWVEYEEPNKQLPSQRQEDFREGFETAEMLWKEKIEEALRRLLK